MSLPVNGSSLAGIEGFVSWRRAVEALLSRIDGRVSASRDTGTAVIFLGTGTPPPGLLEADGSLLNRADYPDLFAAIGTTYNTGGETSATFRLPIITAPPNGVWCVRT